MSGVSLSPPLFYLHKVIRVHSRGPYFLLRMPNTFILALSLSYGPSIYLMVQLYDQHASTGWSPRARRRDRRRAVAGTLSLHSRYVQAAVRAGDISVAPSSEP
jgi:hypothetical protein